MGAQAWRRTKNPLQNEKGGSFLGSRRGLFGGSKGPFLGSLAGHTRGGGLLGVLLGVWGYTKQYIIRAFFENAKDDVVTWALGKNSDGGHFYHFFCILYRVFANFGMFWHKKYPFLGSPFGGYVATSAKIRGREGVY